MFGNKKIFNYELYALVVHLGTMKGGHYIAYVKYEIE
jgi:ubiquitin C-terminal hydrolase